MGARARTPRRPCAPASVVDSFNLPTVSADSPAANAADSDEGASSDSDEEQSVAVAGPADVAALANGDRIAVPFHTRRGEQYFAGSVVRIMPRTARVRFPDVDNGHSTFDVDHNRLFAIRGP